MSIYKKREIENYLIDIKKIAKIKYKNKDKKLQDFLKDKDLEIIVEHGLIIISEAISKIPQEVLLKYYDNSSYWNKYAIISNYRNKKLHRYLVGVFFISRAFYSVLRYIYRILNSWPSNLYNIPIYEIGTIFQ